MCKSHNPRMIDKCMKLAITYLNTRGIKTLASCCGHNRYPKTLIVEHNTNKLPVDIFSLTFIPRKKKFYKKDKWGYYYIPEVINSKHEKINIYFYNGNDK